MSTKWQKKDNAWIIKADGPVVGIKQAREYLVEIKGDTHHYGFLIFDFSEVTEISPAAVRTLTFAASLASQMNAKVAIIGTPVVKKCVADCSLDKLFPCYDSIDQILQASSPVSRLRQDLLEALDEAVKTTFQTISGCQANPIDANKQDFTQTFEIGAVVGIIDRNFKGSLVLGFSEKTFLNLMSKMFGVTYTEVTDEICDGPAEVLNVILGLVKIDLNEKGFGISQAIPTTIRGSNLRIVPKSSKDSSPVYLVFQAEFGNFYVEFNANFESMQAAA